MSHAGFRHRRADQGGTAAVEFALLAVFLFVFIFGTIEVSRVFYLWSTMTQVTNRAARSAAISSPADALAKRWRAMFLSASGKPMALGGAISDANLRIDYLRFDGSAVLASAVPACLALNTLNCLKDPLSDSCVRFVRVRLCQTDSAECAQVPYEPLVALGGLTALRINMPWFTAIAPLQTMGKPGACS